MPGSAVSDLAGRVLAGRYLLHAAIGTGASGRVYVAEDGPAVIPFFKNNITAYRTKIAGYGADPGVNLAAESVWIRR